MERNAEKTGVRWGEKGGRPLFAFVLDGVATPTVGVCLSLTRYKGTTCFSVSVCVCILPFYN